MKISKTHLENCDLTHRFGGNGWAMVQDIDETHCRISHYAQGIGGRAFLAHKDMLEVTLTVPTGVNPPPPEPKEINAAAAVAIKQLREEIASGRMVIKASHIVRAN
jgi:hypothetical protein